MAGHAWPAGCDRPVLASPWQRFRALPWTVGQPSEHIRQRARARLRAYLGQASARPLGIRGAPWLTGRLQLAAGPQPASPRLCGWAPGPCTASRSRETCTAASAPPPVRLQAAAARECRQTRAECTALLRTQHWAGTREPDTSPPAARGKSHLLLLAARTHHGQPLHRRSACRLAAAAGRPQGCRPCPSPCRLRLWGRAAASAGRAWQCCGQASARAAGQADTQEWCR